MNALIFAGGTGTRLWPASRKNKPKQLLSFFGDLTMIEKTYDRIEKVVGKDNIYIATSKSCAKEITDQLKEISKHHFLYEPVRKNRGPALGVMMLFLKKHSSDPYFTTVWSDDHINQEDLYGDTVKLIENHLKNNSKQVLAIGVSPDHPNTSFRYVEIGESLNDHNPEVYQVKQFIDKPEVEMAEKFHTSGKHFWNTGYFFSSVDHVLDLYKEYFPKCFELLQELKPFIGTDHQEEKISEIFPQMPEFDFEELFFKHPNLLSLVPAGFDWKDLGKWDAIKEVQSKDSENLLRGLTINHETKGSLIYNYNPDQLVSTLHADNLIVVVTPEAVLVARKDKAGDLKKIIKQLESDENLHKYL